jgi:hypothetical protein
LNNLWSYTTKNDLMDIAKKIRPILEKYLTVKYPIKLWTQKNQWLGDYIWTIRQSVEGETLYNFKQAYIDELEAINNYSKSFHHHTNTKFDETNINKEELKWFIKRMFNLISS